MTSRNPWKQVLDQVTGGNRKRRRAAESAAGKKKTNAGPAGLAVTSLEDRIAPAFTSLTGTVLTVDFDAAGEAVTLSNDGSNITLTGSTFTGAGSVFATAGVTQLTVTDSGALAGQSLTFAPGTALVFSGGLTSSGVESVAVDNAVTATGAAVAIDAGTAVAVTGPVTAATVGLTAPTVSATAGGAVSVGTSLTVTNTDSASTLAGVISGAGQFIKNGAGTVVVTAANTYAGGTAVNGGALRLGRPAVAKYTFDGTAADVSGNNLNGSLNGGTGTSYPAGKFGQAFQGANAQQVSVPYSAAFGLNSFTVSAWVNMNAGFGGFVNGILGTRFGGDTTFDLKVEGGRIHGDVGNGAGWINTAVDILPGDTGSNGQGGVLTPNTWNLITYVIDDATKQFRLYLNGDLKKTIGYAGTPLLMKPGQTMNIGNSAGGEFMNGKLDDVTVLAQALNAAEVQALYTGVLPLATTVTVAPGAAFDLNGVSQTVGGLAGAGAVTLGGATLTTGAVSTAFSGTMTGAGNLVKAGAGTLTLNSALAYTGTTAVTGGSLFAGAANALPGATALTVVSGATLNMGGFAQTVGSLAGDGTITTTGATGTDTLTAGSLPVGTTFTGVIADAAGGRAVGLTVTGNGVLTLGGASTYSGPTAVNGGVVRLNSGEPQFANAGFESVNIGTGGGAYVYALPGAGWTFNAKGGVAGNGSAFNNAVAADGTQVGIIQQNGTITQAVNFAAAGTYTVSFLAAYRNAQDGVNDFRVLVDGTPVGTFTPTTFASYLSYTTAAFAVPAGVHTIQFAGLNTLGGDRTSFIDRVSINPAAATGTTAIPNGSAVTVASGAILDLNGANEAVASLAGAGGVLLGAGTLTAVGGTTDTFSGVVSGSGGLTRSGTGTTILTGPNTYAGGTTINAGATLQVGSGGLTGTLGTGPVTDDGSLVFNRKNDLTVSNAIGGGGTLTQAGLGVTTLSGTNGYTGATLVNAGALRVDTGAPQFASAGFENVNVGTGPGAYIYGLGGASWTFAGAGVAGNGSNFNNTTAQDGTQVAFLQTTGSIAQAVNFPAAGNYTISFLAASRLGQNHDFQVLVDGTPVGTFSTTSTSFLPFSTASFAVPAGAHTVQFLGLNTLGGDRTSFIDRVSINPTAAVATNALPDASAVTVASGAVLDLNGANETVASLAGAGGVSLGAGTLTAAGATTDTFSGVISGSGGLTRGGTGTTVLTGANTYAGTTTINTGATLQVGSGGATGTLGSGPVTDDGSLVFNRSNGLTVPNAIGGTGTLTQAGTGVTTLSGSNSYGGTTAVNAGTLVAASGSALGATGAGTTVASGATLDVQANIGTEGISVGGAGVGGNGALITSTGSGTVGGGVTLASNTTVGGDGNLTIAGVIGGGSAVTRVGAGKTTLTGESTYSGGTTVNAGTLELADAVNNATGAVRGTLTVNAGATVLTSAPNSLGWGAGTRVTTLNLVGGTLNNTAAGDQGWGIVINMTGGTLQSNGGVTSNAAASYFSLGGGSSINVLASANPSAIGGRINLREGNAGNVLPIDMADGAAATDLLISAAITQGAAGYGVTTSGPGTAALTTNVTGQTNTASGPLTVGNGLFLLGGGANAYAGDGAWQGNVTVNGGAVLRYGQSNIVNNGSDFTVNGTLDLNGFGDAVGNLAGSGNVTNNAGLTLDDLAVNASYSGGIAGTGDLVLRAALTGGSQTVSGTVNVGSLRVGQSTTNTPTLNVAGGSVTTAASGFLLLGDAANSAGNINQTGGTVTSSGTGTALRIGHWAGKVSTYTLAGGTLSAVGNLYVGWDGVGAFTQTGGTVTAPLVFVDGNGLTGPISGQDDTVSVSGGTMTTGTLNVAGGFLDVAGTAAVNATALSVVEGAGRFGTVNQSGGTVTVSGLARIGHWPTATGTYNLSGGALTLTGTSGTNPFGGTEQVGTLYVGVDGTGVFAQTGGTLTAQGVVVDNRGDTAGTDSFSLVSGTLNLGKWGFQGNASTTVALGGATANVVAKADWAANRPVALDGVGPNGVFLDNGGFVVSFSQPVSGAAGDLFLTGSGKVVMTAANTYGGATAVNGGTLVVNGTNSGTGPVSVNNSATLAGSGSIAGSVTVTASAFIAPGNSPGKLNVGNYTQAGTFTAEVNGSETDPVNLVQAGVLYDQINVTGTVAMTGTLALALGYTPAPGDYYVLINNDGTDAVTGAFGNAPTNGAAVTFGGKVFQVYYTGGTGNDVVLVSYDATPAAVYADDSWGALTPGSFVADTDPVTAGNQFGVIGYNAFATVNGALAKVAPAGTVLVNDGTYAEAVTLAGQTLTLLGTDGVTAGTVTLNSLAGTGTIHIASAGYGTLNNTLAVGDGTGTVYAGVLAGVAGNGVLVKQGTGTLALSGANTYGVTTVAAGTLQIGSATAAGTPGTGAIAVAAGANLAVNRTDAYTLGNTVGGAGTLTQSGAGTTTLTASNSYAGGTFVTGGVLSFAADANLGTAPGAPATNITIQNGATLRGTATTTLAATRSVLVPSGGTIDSSTAGQTVTVAGSVTADSRLVFAGAGNTTVTGVVGGTYSVTANKLLEGLINGAGLNTAAANPGVAPGKAGYGGLVSDPRQGQTNTGAWGDNQTWVYTGQFFDADGVISFAEQIDDNTFLRIDGVVRLNDGTWNVATGTKILTLGMGPNGDGWHDFEVRFYNGGGGAGASGQAGWPTTLGFGVNTAGTNSLLSTDYVNPATVSNFFRYTAGNQVVKQGGGTLTLANANTYQGLTLVQGGVLAAANSASLGATGQGVNVAAGGQLLLSGGVTVAENVVLAGSGPADAGALLGAAGGNTVSGPVTFTGPAVIAANAGASLTLTNQVTLSQDVLVTGAGNVTVSGNVVDDGLAGGFAPGLRESRITGNAFDESTRPVGGRIVLRPEAGYNTNGNGSGYWADNNTYVYTGQFFSPTATTVSFGENIDDNVLVRVNGVQVLRDTTWNNPTATGLVAVNAGWNDIEIRFGNGGGGAGPVGGTGWDAFNGFGFVTPGTASNNGANFGTFADKANGLLLRSPAARLIKTGTGTLTLSGTNTYDGPTQVWGGVLSANSASALGSAAGNTAVETGATLLVPGTNLSGEPLTAAGTGAAGQIGAVVSTAAGTVLGPVTAGADPAQVLRIGSTAGLLTVPGIDLRANRVEFTGAGNTTVTGVIAGSAGPVVEPGLAGQYYTGAGVLANLIPADPLFLGNGIPAFTRQTPNVDFGTGTEVLQGTGAVLDRGGATAPANIFGGLGFNYGTSNIGTLWTGRVAIPAAETFVFTTRSDDGSRLWIDLDKNGSFDDAGELLVDNNFFQGMTNRTGTATFAAAGDYPVRIGFMQGGGGYGVQVSWQQTTGAGAFARRIIEPTAFTSVYAPDNRVVMAGTGTLTLGGTNTYAGLTEVRNGVLVANNDAALGTAAAGTVVGVGATLQVAGKNLGGELLVLGGVGFAGQDGALVSTATSTVGAVEALVDTNLARVARVSSLAGLLTVGSVDMKASRFDFSGAGDTTVTGNIVGGAAVATAGLQGKYYANITSVAAALDPTNPAFLDNLTPTVTKFLGANRIDFGSGTETAAGDGSVLDRAGSGGNVFGGVGVNVGIANVGAQWVGFLTVPESGRYEFTTRSDDGTVLWIDQNKDGVFDPVAERVVDNNFDQGMTNRSGQATLAAGSYPVRFGFRQGGGGWGAQFSVQQLTGNGAGARQIVPPTWFTSVSGDNRLRMLGTGTLTLTGTNTHSATDILAGTVKVGNNTASGTLGTGPVANAGSLVFQRTDGYAFGQVISGAGSVTQAGTGTTTLNNPGNSYSGGSGVNAGVLYGTEPGTLGTGTVTMNGGTVRVGPAAAPARTVVLDGIAGPAWQLNAGVTGSVGAPASAAGVVSLTENANNQARSAFTVNPVTSTQDFQAKFVYSNPNTTAAGADGIAFVLQNGSATAVGGVGGGLGYSGLPGTSVALLINNYRFAAGGAGLRLSSAGVAGGPYVAPGGGVVVGNGVPISFTLDYVTATGTLNVTLTQGANTTTVVYTGVVLPANPRVGFTGGTGGETSFQTVTGFRYSAVPLPLNTTAYPNNVVVTPGTTAAFEVAATAAGPVVSMATLTLGAGATALLAPAPGTAANLAYGLTFGATAVQGNETLTVAKNGAATGTLTLGALDDGGTARTVTLTGAGDVALAANAVSLVNGTVFAVNAGTLQSNAATAAGTLSQVQVAAGATFKAGATQQLGGLSGAGSATLNGNTLTVGSTNNLSGTFSGGISNGTAPGNLATAGSGTFTLAGTNTFTGTATVGGTGTLVVNGTNSGGGATTVQTGATLAGTGTITGTVTGNAGSTVAPGVGGPGALAAGSLTLNGTYALNLNGTAAGTQYDRVNVTGGVTVSGPLTAAVGYTPAVYDYYVVIDNDGGDAVTGTFSNAPVNGQVVALGGKQFKIFYTGGTGNDVVLVSYDAKPGTVYVDDSWSSFSLGQFIADADPQTAGSQFAIFGYSAFATVQAGVNESAADGTVYVNDGNYATENVTVVAGQAKFLVALGTNAVTGGSVTLGSLGSSVADRDFSLNYLGVAQTLAVGATGASTTYAGTISGAAGYGTLVKQGSGTFTLTGTNSYGGETVIAAGTLSVPAFTNGGVSGPLGQGVTVRFTGTGVVQYTGAGAAGSDRGILSAGGNLLGTFDVFNAAGSLGLTGNVTFATGDDLAFTGAGTASLTGTAGVDELIAAGAGLTLNGTVTATTLRVGRGTATDARLPAAAGNGALTVAGGTVGATTVLVGDTATATGAVAHTGGTVTASAVTIAAAANGDYTLSGGTLSVANTLTVAVDGAGTFTQIGGTAGVTALDLNAGTAAAGSGTVAVSGGLLKIGGGGVHASDAGGSYAVTLGGGGTGPTLRATAGFLFDANATLAGANASRATFDPNGFTVTQAVAAAFTGAGGLIVNGPGGQVLLNGTNGYTGATTVDGATLGGYGSVTSDVTVNAAGGITGGDLGGVGTFVVKSLTINGGTYRADFSGNLSDTLMTGGAVNVNAGAAGTFAINTQAGTAAPGNVFVLIQNLHPTNAIANPPLTGAAEGASATVNTQTAYYTYKGGYGGNDFTLTAVGPYSVSGATGQDYVVYRVDQGGANDLLQVTEDGVIVDSRPLAAALAGFALVGSPLGGDDTLTVDYAASGGYFETPVLFNAANGGNNALTVTGSSFDAVAYDAKGLAATSVLTFTKAGFAAPYRTSPTTVSFTGVELGATVASGLKAVTVNIDAGNTLAGANALDLSDATGPNLLADLASAGGAFTDLTFSVPTASFVVNGDGSDNDTVTWSSIDGTYKAATAINAGAGDAVALNAPLVLGSGSSAGSLLVTAGTIALNAAADTTAGGATGTVTLTAGSALTLAAGIQTDGGNVALSGAVAGVLVATNVVIDTETGDDSAAGSVDFTGAAVITSVGGRFDLTINTDAAAAAAGNVTLVNVLDADGALTGYDPVNDLFVSALGATKGSVALPGTIDLAGNAGDTSGVTVRGNAYVSATSSIQTDDAVYDGGPIDLSAADVSAKSAGLSLLLVSEATAGTKVGGAVGLGTLSNLAGAFLKDVVIDADTPATAGGAVTLGGAAQIAGDLTVTAGAITSNAPFTAGTGAANFVSLSSETAISDGNAAALNFAVVNGTITAAAVTGAEFDTTAAKLGVTVTAGDATVRETDAVVLTGATVSGTFFLTAGAGVTQTGGVATPNFRLVAGGDATLSAGTNDVGTIAASVTGTLTYTDANDLTVGTIGTVGVTASNGVVLVTGGSLTVASPLTGTAGAVTTTSGGDLTVNAAVSAGGGATLTANNAVGSTILINAAVDGTFAKVYGNGGQDAVTVNATGGTLLQLDLKGNSDTYTVNYGALVAAVAVQDSGSGGTDKAFLNGTPAADTFEVNEAGFPLLVRVGTQKVTYTGTLEEMTLDGGDAADTFNVQLANGPLPGVFTVADTGAVGTDTANLKGTALADLFDVNFTTAQRVALGSENVDYTAGLETLNVYALDGNDTFRVKPTPNALVTEINLYGGNPVAPVGDTVILNVVGVTNPVITNPAIPNGNVTSTSHKTVTWNSIETFPVPLGLGGTFDFNARNTAGFPETQPGWLPTLATDTFAGGAYAGAAGWQSAALGYDRKDLGLGVAGQASALLSDGAWGYDGVAGQGVFRVTTGPNVVRVMLTAGDTYFRRDYVAVYANNETTPRYVFNTDVGQFDQAIFDVDMTGDADGVLELTIRDEAGYSYWTVNSLDVRPLGLVAPLTLPTIAAPGSSDLLADGLTADTYSGSKAQPGTLLTVTAAGGTGRVTTPDADTGIAGLQVLVDGSGNFAFDFLRGTGTSDVTFTVQDVYSNAKTVVTQTGYDLPTVRKIDFGPASGPVQAGYLGFPVQTYTSTSKDALGWTGSNTPGEFTRTGGAGDLLRDGAYNRRNLTGVYRLDLPAGDYWVTATLGDALQPRTGENVFGVTGTVASPLVAVNTAAGEYFSGTFKASTTAGGVLELGVNGGGSYWSLNALEVRPYTAPLTLAGPGTAPADGATPVTVTGTGARPGEPVTVTTAFGTITSPDASPFYKGVQVLADGSGNFSFDFTPAVSTTATTAYLTATGVFGGVVANRTQALAAAPPVPPAGGSTQRFDFNANTPGPTATGFTAVRGGDVYAAAAGYGWAAGQLEFERTAASVSGLGVTANQVPLYQDGVYGYGSTPGVFQVKVAAGTTGINARVYLGDSYSDWPYITVQAEGGPVVSSPGRFAAITLAGSDQNSDGVFTITIGNQFAGSIWVANGIDVSVGGSLPGLPLAAAPDFGTTPAGTAVSAADLARTVDAAVARWAAAGATPGQLAALRATPVELGDLTGTGHYGENVGPAVVIDATAAGRGWFVDPTPLADEEFAAGRPAVAGVDLLTVVMHEFGHTLGRIDLDPAAHPGDLMAGALGAGERRLPAPAVSVVRLDGPSEVRGVFVGDAPVRATAAADKVFVGADTFAAPVAAVKPAGQTEPTKSAKAAAATFDEELLAPWVG